MKLQVPGYRVGPLIGYGSRGAVFAATTAAGEGVALKVIERVGAGRAGEPGDPAAEAALLARLDHPGLIRLHQFVRTPERDVLVLDLAAGGSLSELLARRGRLTVPEVVAALSPVASALAYAHSAEVLHGDVSAANVLFTVDGRPLLADLGLGRMFGTAPPEELLGTPAYLDPQVVRGGVAATFSDVFGLAALTLHAATGFGPWHRTGEESAEELISTSAVGVPIDLDARVNDLPPALARLIRRGLDEDPFRRGSAAEYAVDLAACLSTRGVAVTPPRAVVLGAGRIPPVGRHSVERRAAELEAVRRSQQEGGSGAVLPSGLSAPASSASAPPRSSTSWSSRGSTRPASGFSSMLGSSRVARPRARSAAAELAGASARPAFARPRQLGGDLVRTDLTQLARPRIRPDERPVRRRRLRSLSLRRAVLLAGSAALLVVAAIVVVVRGGPASSADPRPAARPMPSGARPTRPSSHDQAANSMNIEVARSTLADLDRQRGAAYALRRPDLLERVYSSAGLLAQDRDQLLAAEPQGCHLDGLNTRYDNVVLARVDPGSVRVLVTARMSRVTLRCAGRPPIHSPERGPTRLVIELSPTAEGYRISSQRTA
ncbi:serine/threonine protein kinase [Jatrophihabitans telluris]|uniref:non-specific serine/threonine protein kinase n=1 Tax=Jatrophihabitans telluris TaxID=2038343 RepID=A0ABY4QV29_9ACTN|nr:serine/threonine-protein kinase [Jatrophihabitans telluris]UQX87278.1 serine/threonine protein kinase [Jatrophihabitans telluris]